MKAYGILNVALALPVVNAVVSSEQATINDCVGLSWSCELGTNVDNIDMIKHTHLDHNQNNPSTLDYFQNAI